MRPFVDTNVLVYAHDADEPDKREAALGLLAEHAGTVVVSAQVLTELYVVLTRKLARPLDPATAAAQVEALGEGTVVPTDTDLVRTGLALARSRQLSLWDALVVTAAQRAGCDVLLTEDLQHDAVFDGVRVVNPFPRRA